MQKRARRGGAAALCAERLGLSLLVSFKNLRGYASNKQCGGIASLTRDDELGRAKPFRTSGGKAAVK